MQGVELELELEVDSGVRLNMVKRGNLQTGWELEVVFKRRSINEKWDAKSNCIFVCPCALVKVDTKVIIYF